ncbi:hypothetical protein HNR67_003210 [Crossiella cryophila]|uniref:Uncharacterized protein n=1 Tax=Crossiella cryophila TaxID=43355 RepID=A0A7W7FTD1_9PSEU|nr:hypothetical protein [Crossiella cryophila]
MAFQHSPSGSPIPVSLERTHHIPGAQTATCRRPSLSTATVCVPGMWFGIGGLTGMGEPHEHCSSSLLLFLDFPPHPLIPARPARTILIVARVPQHQRPTAQRSRAEKMASPAGQTTGGGRADQEPGKQVAGRGLCCRGRFQRGSEGSCVLRTAFRKPTTPRGAAPVAFGRLGRRQVAGAAPRGAVSKLQAVRRTHDNPRRGGLPPTPNPAPSHNSQRPVQQRPTLRTTTANTAYKNGQHGGWGGGGYRVVGPPGLVVRVLTTVWPTVAASSSG